MYQTTIVLILMTFNHVADMATEMVTVSAPGKVILHGEHSVVYGKMALAVSINLRTKLTMRFLENENNNNRRGQLKVNLPDLNIGYIFDLVQISACFQIETQKTTKPSLDFNLVNRIKDLVASKYPDRIDDMGIIALLYLYVTSDFTRSNLTSPRSLEVTVTSDIPIGAGLGSSAAFSVAISAGLFKLGSNNNGTYL
jgi:mevalonate kinase